MSTVAKVFVVLNFLLAALFLGSAAAVLGHSDNWKKRYEALQDSSNKEIGQLKADVAAREGQITKLQGDKVTAEGERSKARQEADTLKTQNESILKAYNELNSSMAAATRANQVAQATIQQSRDLVNELQKERQTLIDNLTKANEEKIAAVKMQNQLELNVADLSAQQKSTEAKLSESELKLQRTTFELESIKRANPGIGAGSEQPWQTAKVLAADNEANIVVISIGSEDGVKAGFRYTVSRGNQYVATIEITTVNAKQSAGRVVNNMRKGPVAPGDDVMTASNR